MFRVIRRCCSSSAASVALPSSLYIPGSYGTRVARTVVPDLKVLARFPRPDELVANLAARKLSEDDLGIKAADVEGGCRYIDWMTNEWQYSVERQELLQRQLDEVRGQVGSHVEEKKAEFFAARQAAKKLMREKWDVEEKFILPLLKYPNVLRPETPVGDSDAVVVVRGEKPSSGRKIPADLVEFSDVGPSAYFLRGRLAALEIELAGEALDALGRSLADSLVQISCPDIVRSAVVEGCYPGSFNDPDAAFSLEKCSDFGDISSGLGAHLVGGASLPAMFSFLVKSALKNAANSTPINYACNGRTYKPAGRTCTNTRSILDAEQNSAVGVLSATDSADSMMDNALRVSHAMRDFFDEIDVHYRVVHVRAAGLELSESMRMSFQMFSPVTVGGYVEVASVSVFDDFISQRLLFKYITEGDDKKNVFNDCYVTGGNFANLTKVIALMAENGHGRTLG